MSARRGNKASLSGQKRGMSMSEIINEQFNEDKLQRDRETDAWDEFGSDGPRIDDYRENGGHDESRTDVVDSANSGSVHVKKRNRTERFGERETPKRLRHRGPLDASLSVGDYAATPMDVEAMMDGIFGALEMDDDDDDENFALSNSEKGGGGGDDDDGGAAVGKKHRKEKKKISSKKPDTEEAYTAWIEAKQKKKQQVRHYVAAAADEEEGNILDQLESLRNAQMELLAKEAQSGTTAATATGNENTGGDESDPYMRQRKLAQEAVRHYVMVYSQLLRVRIKMQPAVTRVVAFPQYYAFPDFLHSDNTQLNTDMAEVSHSLGELLGIFYALAAPGTKQKQHQAHAVSFKEINDCHRRIMTDVDACIDYWGSKLVQTNSVKLRSISQPLLDQIRAVLGSKARLRAKVQKNRSHVAIVGHPLHYRALQSAEAKAERALRIAEGDIDDEIYDDADFLREVVRRGGVSKLEQQLKELQRDLQSNGAPAKRGFHRLTKGKALNYEPRPKLVGFLLPVPYTLGMQHEVVMNSLFQ